MSVVSHEEYLADLRSQLCPMFFETIWTRWLAEAFACFLIDKGPLWRLTERDGWYTVGKGFSR